MLLLLVPLLSTLVGWGESTDLKPCVDTDGAVYNSTCVYIVQNCTKAKVCKDGKIVDLAYRGCPHNAYCWIRADAQNCRCKDGYEFDIERRYCRKIGWKVPEDDSCVDWEVDEKAYPARYRNVHNNCSAIHHCSNGRLLRSKYSCEKLEECVKTEDGQEECQCRKGLQRRAGECVEAKDVKSTDCYVPELRMTFHHGMVRATNNCTKQHICSRGKYYSRKYSCATEHGGCALDKSGWSYCYCDEGYIPWRNHQECVPGFE